MTWTKLGSEFGTDPALLALSRGARLLHVEALCWSNAQGTDGRLPRHMLHRITDEPEPHRAATDLVRAGKWSATDDGWHIVEFLRDQLSAAEVAERNHQNAERTRRWRNHREGRHHLCLPERCDAARNAARDAARTGPSVPSRSDRNKGHGTQSEGGDAARPRGPAATAEKEVHVPCHDYSRHQSHHRLSGNAWVCDLCVRRDLAKIIREAPTQAMRHRYRKAFDRTYGPLYRRSHLQAAKAGPAA